MEWFLKYLLLYIAKYVSTSGVTTKEQVIFRSQKLDLIYIHSGLLYEIIPDAPWSNVDPKFNIGPHVDGIVHFISTKVIDEVTTQLKKLSINQSVARQAMDSSTPTQSTDVCSM